MREIRTSGSVGALGSNPQGYPAHTTCQASHCIFTHGFEGIRPCDSDAPERTRAPFLPV